MEGINVEKTNEHVNIQRNAGKYKTEEMTNKVVEFCKLLMMDCDEFTNAQSEKTFNLIYEYIKKYNRILYSPISNICYECFRESNTTDKIGSLISNIEKVSMYSGTVNYKHRLEAASKAGDEKQVQYLKDTAKAIVKIWDHVNLAQTQYTVLNLTDDEYRKKMDEFITPIKEGINEDINNLSSSMSAQLLTMVGIFTALAFLIFGGISSLDNILSNAQLPIFKLMVIGCVWGLCILNLVFVFLFCVGKMTRLNFKSAQNKDASIFQKYPIVWWSDLSISAIMLFSIWGYYITKENVDGWFDKICKENPIQATVIGILVIAIVVCLAARKLIKETKYTNGNED